MDTVITQKRNGIEIIVGFDRQCIDPEATKKAVDQALASGVSAADVVSPEYVVRFPLKPGEHAISAAIAAGLKSAAKQLPTNHVLTTDGEVLHRFDTMTEAEISEEREAFELKALNEARKMRSGLEIKGEKNALDISQAFYDQEMERIEQAYTK
jgi:hypothetical protein